MAKPGFRNRKLVGAADAEIIIRSITPTPTCLFSEKLYHGEIPDAVVWIAVSYDSEKSTAVYVE